MGFFRRSLLTFFCILLLISLIALNLFFTLSLSLKYENVQKEISPLIQRLATDSNAFEEFGLEGFDLNKSTDETMEKMRAHCLTNTDYVFSFENYTISIPCSSLSGGKMSVVNETAKSMIKEFYYKNYECDFWNCFSQEGFPFFLVSQKAKDYWNSKFYLFLVISLVLFALCLLLSEKKSNGLILTGSLFVLSSLPLLKIENFIISLTSENLNPIYPLLNIFFSEAKTVFWISFIIGVVLVCAGFWVRFVGFGQNESEKKQTKKKTDKKN